MVTLSPRKQKHPQFLESLNFSPVQKGVSLNIADFLSPGVSVWDTDKLLERGEMRF